MLKTFKGGIHPHDNKEHTRYLKIEEMSAPKTMIYPVSQHIGAPSEVVVQVGDNVKVGQLLAKATSFVSTNQHSSVSGVVTAVEPRLHPNGTKVMSVVVENDEKYEMDESVKPAKPLSELSKKEIVDIVLNAGIVGMGGASFPTHVKLSPPPEAKIDYIIINGSECEPYLTSDHRVMLEDTDMLIFGCEALAKALGEPENIVIAIEANKQDAIKAISETVSFKKSRIQIVTLKTKYPQGSEKHLIKAVTKRSVPAGKLPSDVGCAVFNIDTCAATARAIKTGKPVVSRIVTISGNAASGKRNFRVRIGTPVKDVIEAAGGVCDNVAKLILGGPMMGNAVYSDEVPVIKGTGAILLMTEEELDRVEHTNCLRCGKCVDACPMFLQPVTLANFAKLDKLDEALDNRLMECIECGACSYVCPARYNPLQKIRVLKYKFGERRKKNNG